MVANFNWTEITGDIAIDRTIKETRTKFFAEEETMSKKKPENVSLTHSIEIKVRWFHAAICNYTNCGRCSLEVCITWQLCRSGPAVYKDFNLNSYIFIVIDDYTLIKTYELIIYSYELLLFEVLLFKNLLDELCEVKSKKEAGCLR